MSARIQQVAYHAVDKNCTTSSGNASLIFKMTFELLRRMKTLTTKVSNFIDNFRE